MSITGRYSKAVIAVVTIAAAAVSYTVVRCVNCRRRVMSVPGTPRIDCREVYKLPTGKGRTLTCPRCSVELEVIEHG